MKLLTRYILSEYGGKAIKRPAIDETCERFGANSTNTVNNMISYGYLIRILRGLYYVKTREEFADKKAVDAHRVIALGMEALGIGWYFGLYTALSLGGATHEYAETITVINDRLFRPKDVKIAGRNVRFVKVSHRLFGFGIIEKGAIRYSNLEKTLLDMAYLSKYRSVPESRIAAVLDNYSEGTDESKLKEYSKSYPMSVGRMMKHAGLI
jgi:predicted transcriptional regulator of viral defense system